jgi:4'-phosphopantetheinyl transferase
MVFTRQRSSQFLRLSGRAVHVWALRTAAPDVLAEPFKSILAADEAGRAERFRFRHLRRSFEVSHGALRILLGLYLGRVPSDVHFDYGVNGKPTVANDISLKFNLSHSDSLSLLAFTLDCELGVDLERIRPLPDADKMADQFFCPEEAAELKSVSADERDRAFFLCWTRKEAYLKAIGDGLFLPLDTFRVTVRPNAPANLIHVAHDTNAARKWTLHNVDLEPGYAAALAYRDAPRPTQFRCPELSDLLHYANLEA